MALPRKPRLLFEKSINRRLYFRRFVWSLLAAVAALAAFFILDSPAAQGIADAQLSRIGRVITLVGALLFGLRAVVNLWYGLRRRTETLRFYDRGFVWQQGQKEYKYKWSHLHSYRESGGGLYLGKWVLYQWGGSRFVMRDRRVFTVTGKYGNLRRFKEVMRRYPAHVTGIRMGQTLRQEKPIRLHKQLTVWPGGIQAGKQEIPWSEVEVSLKRGQLAVLQKDAKGRFKTVKRYRASRVDNVGGFLEVARATIPTHQRERFQKPPA
ncbi:MAG: YcxB family protein [Anaerolineaceae bacterium]|nr:YcxB family protein [Anaerolineaceae bacterium]